MELRRNRELNLSSLPNGFGNRRSRKKCLDENDIIRSNADAMRCARLRTQAHERNHSAESGGQ